MTAPTISTEGLRELLERGAPVTVLDVRPAAEHAEWSIPGSVHADAYDALRRGDPTVLEDFHPNNGGRVVTVCAAGKTTMLAAGRLRARGLDAVSLAGGMRAWSLAWNTAEVPCPGSTARIVQLRRAGKGCLSYLIGSNGAAVVIDASLDPQVYHRLADEHGWRIRTILETHVHADHLFRARALAADTGAKLYFPATDRVSFEYAPLNDGDTVRVGSAGLRVLHTPGHTPESACYLLDDCALFTGDTLFLAAVGRPDLEATTEQWESRAHVLHASLQRLLALPPETVILPAHTSEPVAFDGRPISATLEEVQERTSLLRATDDAFASQIVARLPVPLLIIRAPSWGWIVFANVLLGVNQGLCWSTTVIMKIDLVGPARRGLAMGLNEFAGYVAVSLSALLTGYLASAHGLRPAPFYPGIAFAVLGLLLSVFAVDDTHGHARLEAHQRGAQQARPGFARILLLTSWRDRALFAASQAGMVNNLNDGMVWGLIPVFLAARGVPLDRIGVVTATYPLVWGIGQLATGALSDWWGRKWMIASGMWVQAVGIAAFVVGRSFSSWMAGATLLGIGTALVYPTLLAAVSDVAHPDWRASAVGVYRLWRDSGYAIGAIAAGLLADLFTMQSAIGAIAALTFVSGVVVAGVMYGTLPENPRASLSGPAGPNGA